MSGGPKPPEFYRDQNNDHRWRVEGGNGTIIGAATQGFASKQKAEENLNLLVCATYEPEQGMLTLFEEDERYEHVRGGELKGKQWQPRDLAELLYDAGWQEPLNLATMLAVLLSESQGFQEAVNDNLADDGTVKSRDCGLLQINIPASKIGTDEERRLFDEPEYNIARGRMLFSTRSFQPWYGYTQEVYLRDSYVKRAARGVGNFLAEQLLARTPTDILSGEPYVHKLTNPVLDYSYRVATLAHGMDTVVARARQLKPIGGPAVDALSDEIIRAAVTAKAITKT